MPYNVTVTNGIALLEGDQLSSNVIGQGFPPDGIGKEIIIPLLKPGHVVVDAGAALGDHTVACIKAVGPTGRVIAFEPHPKFFECLQYNCPEAELYNAFLWASESSMYLDDGVPGNAGASCATAFGKNDTYGPIRAMPLDSLALQRLDLIKLDCEGTELLALKGAEKTIRRCKPIIVSEVSEDMMAHQLIDIEEFYAFLHDIRYDHKPVTGDPAIKHHHFDIMAWPIDTPP